MCRICNINDELNGIEEKIREIKNQKTEKIINCKNCGDWWKGDFKFWTMIKLLLNMFLKLDQNEGTSEADDVKVQKTISDIFENLETLVYKMMEVPHCDEYQYLERAKVCKFMWGLIEGQKERFDNFNE